jgi:hypothetical protein
MGELLSGELLKKPTRTRGNLRPGIRTTAMFDASDTTSMGLVSIVSPPVWRPEGRAEPIWNFDDTYRSQASPTSVAFAR